jgi:DNA-binding SARP family transcriptional activator
MGILQVALLGGVRVTHDEGRNEVKLTREIQALLAYLLLHRHRTHSREVLVGVFWAECSPEKARRALNTAVWRLKKVVEPSGIPGGTYLISTHPGELGFNRQSQYWLDAEVFEQEANNLLAFPSQEVNEANVHNLERVLELYGGELLEGFYDDWALRERERLRGLYLRSLTYLVQYHRFQKSYEKATAYGQKILDLDPIREDIHRDLMRLYLESGQRALAARQYGICQLTLAKELGVLPMEETRLLYAKIFPESYQNNSPHSSQETLNFEQALGQLTQISHTIALARAQVQQAMQSFANHIRPEGDKLSVEPLSKKGTNKARKRRIAPQIE